jgi:fatty acid desaturase
MDYGIYQMITNIDRKDVKSNKFLNLTLFGFQTLHHLFPTLDHNVLPMLDELFIDTCIEFNIQVRELSWWTLIIGYFEQLERTKRMSLKEMRI